MPTTLEEREELKLSGREDTRLVDQLYGELSEKEAREYQRALEEDPALASEAEALESFEETLGLMRRLEDEEPSAHLDSLILAHAREEAAKLAESEKGFRGFLKKMFRSPAIGLAVAGSVAVVALVTVPMALLRQNEPVDAPALEMAPPAPAQTRSELRETVKSEEAGEAKVAKLEPPPPPPESADTGQEYSTPPARVAVPRKKSKREAPAAERDIGGLARGAPSAGAGEGFAFDSKKAAEEKPAAAADDASLDDVAKEREVETIAKDATRPKPATPRRSESEPQLSVLPSEVPPVVATTQPPAAEKKTIDLSSAARYAQDVIRAAETQLGLKDSIGARRILVNGLNQTKGTPAYGEIALRLAQLDYAERRLADAARNARVAANVPAFAKRRMALDLADRAEREAATENMPAKAEQAAPASVDAEKAEVAY